MIHTMTIQYQMDFSMMRTLLDRLKFSQKAIQTFLHAGYEQTEELYYDPQRLGIEEMKLSNFYIYDSKKKKSKRHYIFYIRLEPLTLIRGEQHIELFECTEENLKELYMTFSVFILTLLNISITGDSLASLANLLNWEAQRVDYTADLRLNNPDEVLLFINLAKLSGLENIYNKSQKPSTYGDNFFDKSFKFGNNSWEITLYNKQEQVLSKKNLPHMVKDRQVDEAENIVRIEYQRKTQGTKKSSTHYESRNIGEFLNEDRATKWLYECYESTIGYEDFYVQYHAMKAIDAAFPMNDTEIKADKKNQREAEALGNYYEPETHSKKAKNLMNYMLFIANHKGINNAVQTATQVISAAVNELRSKISAAELKSIIKGKDEATNDVEKVLNSVLGKVPKDFVNSIPELIGSPIEILDDKKKLTKAISKSVRGIFRQYNKKIRDKVKISPIMIPDAWIYKRKNRDKEPLNIPHDIFKNPMMRPADQVPEQK